MPRTQSRATPQTPGLEVTLRSRYTTHIAPLEVALVERIRSGNRGQYHNWYDSSNRLFSSEWVVEFYNNSTTAKHSLSVWAERDAGEPLRKALKAYFEDILLTEEGESMRIWMTVRNSRIDLVLRKSSGLDATPLNQDAITALRFLATTHQRHMEAAEQNASAAQTTTEEPAPSATEPAPAAA